MGVESAQRLTLKLKRESCVLLVEQDLFKYVFVGYLYVSSSSVCSFSYFSFAKTLVVCITLRFATSAR